MCGLAGVVWLLTRQLESLDVGRVGGLGGCVALVNFWSPLTTSTADGTSSGALTVWVGGWVVSW
jgi:hypothetical protein